jgi:hypothetical protein
MAAAMAGLWVTLAPAMAKSNSRRCRWSKPRSSHEIGAPMSLRE